MRRFQILNNVTGWVVCAIACVVYLMTMEPTASFWDCGEFITSAYKLEVGHPPGAPFFMLLGNFFTHFASDPSQVAMMVNAMSAIFSGLTILFLFWSITHLAHKLVAKGGEALGSGQTIAVIGAGVVGALAYAFSDTFWYSAVEGEVYASSSLFTAVVFWLILKWEAHAEDLRSDKWLILIAYLMGLSIGVHLLNLLCIPAIALVFYFKRTKTPTLKGGVIALLLSFALVGSLMYGFIQGLVKVASWSELFFVNTIGMPYNSGVILYLVAVAASLAWGLYESTRPELDRNKTIISFVLSTALLGIPFIGGHIVLGLALTALLVFGLLKWKTLNARFLNTALTMMMVLVVGYSSYALIVVRSSANPPMDQNSPEDIFTLASYLNREQYGNRPLIYGETFASEPLYDNDGTPVTTGGSKVYGRVVKESDDQNDEYVVVSERTDYTYVPELNMLFPRMYSKQPHHINAYKGWTNFEGRTVQFRRVGENATAVKPTFGENILFFVRYQLNFMYWRYFMWNFSGRQNDIQGNGEVTNGNWITGFDFIDELMVGPQTNMPNSIANNKGHNKYYMLPLLLGLFGLIYQLYAGRDGHQGFWIIFMLFFMTGIAIVIYLNQTPYQPRERDYAYAGSFYAFAIWIGLGVVALADWIGNLTKEKVVAAIVASLLCLAVPTIMASENWDDHDRSERYTCRDFGANYLTSCAPNAIIFTNGDNDTFPLWYNQEVEGYRTDVRVCNLSYLQTDWYIDQMKREAYDSKPLPISWSYDLYAQGRRDFAYVYPTSTEPVRLDRAMAFLKSDDPRTKTIPNYGEDIDYIPAERLFMPIDTTTLNRPGGVPQGQSHLAAKQIDIDLSGMSNLGKHELMVLEMLQTNQWERPMYYAVTTGEDSEVKLGNYFQLEGLAKRLVPINTKEAGNTVNTDLMFDNMVNKFKWGGIENPDIYLDETNIRMCKTFRYMFIELAQALINEGDMARATIALDHCQKVIPETAVEYDYSVLHIGLLYYQIGEIEKGRDVLRKVGDNCIKNLDWYFRLTPKQFASVTNDINDDLGILQQIIQASTDAGDETLLDLYEESFNGFYMTLQSLRK